VKNSEKLAIEQRKFKILSNLYKNVLKFLAAKI